MKQSMFDPYKDKIQQLLFDGYSIAEAHEYMVKYFGLYSAYSTFYKYVIKTRLEWFIPDHITRGMRERMREKQILEFIKAYIAEHGYSPSFEEIRVGVGLASKQSVHYHVKRMTEKGMLESDAGFGTPRAIRVPGYKFMEVS